MSLWIRLVALVLYITVVCRYVKSRRFPACLLDRSSNYSGKRPSYIYTYTNNVPPCDNDSCETTNLVISVALCSSQGCTICVDTLHYLCRVCFERSLFKGILYSWNILFCRIHLFWRLIIFRIMFRIKGGIYTNNVPCLNEWAVSKHSRCLKNYEYNS